MNSLKKLVKVIRTSKRIAVATHFNPDGDGIAAALACAHLIRHYKRRKPVLYCHSPIPAKYQFLLGKTWQFVTEIPACDLIIAVDSPQISRVFAHMGHIRSARLDAKTIANIDHHKSNNGFGEICIIDRRASSTSEIMYSILAGLEVRIRKPLAEILYCGIYSDTGGFTYPNTTSKCLRVAADLVATGVQAGPLIKKLNAKTLDGTLLLSKVLNTIEIHSGIGSMYLTQAMLNKNGATMADSENFVSFLQAIEGVRVSMFLREEKKRTRISFRSDGIVDVDRLARRFGGGGHRLAAGVLIKRELHEAKREMLKAIRAEMRKK